MSNALATNEEAEVSAPELYMRVPAHLTPGRWNIILLVPEIHWVDVDQATADSLFKRDDVREVVVKDENK